MVSQTIQEMREHEKLYRREWRENHPGYVGEQRKHLRIKALRIICNSDNPKCIYCGCDDIRFLEINHKNGGGSKAHKAGFSTGLIQQKIVNGELPIEDFEVTCRICNSRHYLGLKFGQESISKFRVVWV